MIIHPDVGREKVRANLPQSYVVLVLLTVLVVVFGLELSLDLSRTMYSTYTGRTYPWMDNITDEFLNITHTTPGPHSYADTSATDGPIHQLRRCRQEERVAHMERVCSQRPQARHAKWMAPRARSTVDHKHGIMMCFMSKAGCTAFKALLLDASGYNITEHRLGHSLMRVHIKEFLQEHGLAQFGSLSKEEAQKVLDTYFKFILIRHPFERLLSTYRGKVLDRGSDFPGFGAGALKLAYPEIFENNQTLAEMKAPQKILGPPTLSEFLQWIKEKGVYNDHWSMIVEACRPCANPWSAIMRLETMEHDSQLLLERLKPDLDIDRIPVRHSHQGEPVHDHDWVDLPEFASINEDVIDYFLDLYKLDMEMFGYHWDKRTNTASCMIQTPDGPCC